MQGLRQILLGSLSSSLSSPPGHCSVGPHDPEDCHPEEGFVHQLLARGGSGGSGREKPPARGEVSDGRRRPDADDSAPADTRYKGHTGQGDAGFGIPDAPVPTL